jgi:replicative DNA helicase
VSFSDTESEKAVLAGLVKYGKDAHVDTSDVLIDECFNQEVHQKLYKIVKNLLDKTDKVDMGSILIGAESVGVKLKPEVKEYISKLFSYPIQLENVRRLAEKLRRLDITKRLYFQVSQAGSSLEDVTGDEKLDEILNLVEAPIYDFCHSIGISGDNEAEHLHTGLDEYTTQLELAPVDQIGIPTGFQHLDKCLGGGLISGGFGLIGARMKVGKSTLADQIALNASNYGVPTLMLDTEMYKQKHWYRILANLSGVEVDDIRTGRYALDAYKLNQVEAAKLLIKNSSYYYKNVAGKSFSEILGIARRWLYKTVGVSDTGINQCLVILDYFKLSQQDSKNDKKEYELIGYQAGALSDFCIKYEIPALAFVQLNRQGIDRESSDVISQSDRLGWSCTSFSIFKEKTSEEILNDGQENGNRKIIPLLTRDGEPVDEGTYIHAKLDGKFARVEEIGPSAGQTKQLSP